MKADAKAKMAEAQSKSSDPPPRPHPRPHPQLIQNSRRGGGKQKDTKGDRVEEEKNGAVQEVSTHSTSTMQQPHLKLVKGGSFRY